MKKHRFSSLLKTIFLLCVGFVVLTLSSCENFMQGADVRSQLDKAVSFANAKNCSLFISQETEMGTFLSSGEKECKVGYSVEIVFNLKKDYYIFNGLKAISIDETESRDDCIEFTLNEEASDISKGIYKITAKLLKYANDIMIKADCTVLPRVLNYLPSSTDYQYANTPIMITFNMPVAPEDFNGNYSIKLNDTDLAAELFEIPIFSNNNTVVTIRPKPYLIKSYIKDQNLETIKFKVILTDSIIVKRGDKSYSLVQDNNSCFFVNYNTIIEDTSPVKQTLFLTRHPVTLEDAQSVVQEEKFNRECVGTVPEEIYFEDDTGSGIDWDVFNDYCALVAQNRTNGIVYIYGEYNDPDGGVKSIKVLEKRTNDSNSKIVDESSQLYIYTEESEDTAFSTVDGITSFCVKHVINTEDGAVLLTVTVSDIADNDSDPQEFTAIKRSRGEITHDHAIKSYYYYDLINALEENTISIDEYNEALKTIEYEIFIEDNSNVDEICCIYFLDDYDLGVNIEPQKVELKYEHSNGDIKTEVFTKEERYIQFDFSGNDSWYGYHLLDVDSVSGLTITIIVTDDLGNKATRDFRLPAPEDLVMSIQQQGSSNKAIVKFSNIYKSDYYELYGENGMDYIYQIKQNELGDIIGYSCEYGDEIVIEYDSNHPSYKYQMSADVQSQLLTEFHNIYYSFNPNNSSPDIGNVSKGSPEYVIKTSSIKKSRYFGPWIDITVNVSQESANYYDSIYAECTWVDKYSNNRSEIVFFSPHETNTIIQLDSETVHMYPLNITVYGIKNQQTTTGTAYTTINLKGTTDPQYDNIPPEVILEHYSDRIEFSVTDIGTGPNIGIIDFLNQKLYSATYDSTIDELIIKIPFWEFQKEGQYYYEYNYSALDNIGNSSSANNRWFYLYDLPVGSFSNVTKNANTGTLVFKTNEFISTDSLNKENIKIYVYSNDKKDWVSLANRYQPSDNTYTLTKEDGTDGGSIYVLSTNGSCALNNYGFTYGGTYIKIISSIYQYAYAILKQSVPGYFFTGIPGAGGNTDKLIPAADSVVITSDKPVLVTTFITDTPYEQCKRWSYREWENYKKHLGEKILQFGESNMTPKTYDYPVDEIKAGECFVVLARYSTGEVKMSPVMVKD